PKDIHERFTKGTRPGGQNRNKRETAVILWHLSAIVEVKSEVERTQDANRHLALATLTNRVAQHYLQLEKAAENSHRKSQLGCGARGDKIRTYREQDDTVTDHRTGKKARLRDILSGKLEILA